MLDDMQFDHTYFRAGPTILARGSETGIIATSRMYSRNGMGVVEQNDPNHTPLLSASLRWWERQATKNMREDLLRRGWRRERRRERRAVPGIYMRVVLWLACRAPVSQSRLPHWSGTQQTSEKVTTHV